MTHERDAHWMHRALRLAARGRGSTSPNPMVGAMVVKRGRLVGEGYHRKLGGPHAEVRAISAAGAGARGATLYVTLEPCCHYGRTPPCTDAIIEAGLSRVVAACLDPFPRVNGRGVRALRAAGIAVDVGVLEAEARQLNGPYFKHTTTGLPWVTLKAALSLDGKIATEAGESKWITGERARTEAHRLRAVHDAVLVGVGTVLADDPRLTCRKVRGGCPLRAIVDSRARTPATAAVLTADERPPIIAVTRRAPARRVRRLKRAGAEVWTVASQGGRVHLKTFLGRLGKRGVQSVLLEGGGTVAAAALADGLVDRVYFFVAPRIIGGAQSPTAVDGVGVSRLADAWRITSARVRRLGDDVLITGDIEG
jgi:diaminohydroxyphosphoribosylaminopyrimidine deaminase/5-amino-6-(5-phosphoribosylamino)uracil reductase